MILSLTAIILDIETTGLNPLEDEIVAVGMRTPSALEVHTAEDNTERALVEHILLELSRWPNPVLVGYNITGFDLPFLTARGLKHSLPVHVLRDCYRIDLMHIVQRYLLTNRRYCKLSEIASFLDIRVEDDVTGADVPELVRQGRWDEVEDHCRKDVETTYRLFRRLQELALHNLQVRYNVGPLQMVEVNGGEVEEP
ncbi:MAG: ribonuclease H-like domain-containing protein [Archaeoglobus sp.]|uniref:ribonuclease H-like domain-containing protein n=1 Tax=Archaeoglobus sp. TaxID=1872626 RepID=UPI001DCF4E23|nr:ribonuclease H-like domain-containing protein [Archaeoglobus sp.]MBO8179854.1 ribonuclease H-like domain-containing protein [Archaeoglobus sp.]